MPPIVIIHADDGDGCDDGGDDCGLVDDDSGEVPHKIKIHEADDKDDDQENEASVICQPAAPLAHLEGKHRTKTCSLHSISIFFKQSLF